MTIHHVSVKPETIAVLLEAAETAKMTLVDFEGWVLDDWAKHYEQLKRKIKEQESKHATS